MCYEERRFRSWFTKRTHNRERDTAPLVRSGPLESPPQCAASRDTARPGEAQRKQEQRELEEIV
jgi:hypothetical protein